MLLVLMIVGGVVTDVAGNAHIAALMDIAVVRQNLTQIGIVRLILSSNYETNFMVTIINALRLSKSRPV